MLPKPLIVIAGPTASGKTALAVAVSRLLDGEIISADSMQVYKHLSVGTAKPTTEELQDIPCHLIDHISPDDQYNLGRFVSEASAAIKSIRSRSRVPIICGGTGMYIRGLIYGVFEGGEPPLKIREDLEAIASREGLAPLFAELQQVDPASANRYGPNDRQRIIRALEVYRSSGRPFSQYHSQDPTRPLIPAMTYILTWPRPLLYDRINQRVDQMVASGLLEEIRDYLQQGFSRNNPAIQALGYYELIDHLEGHLSLHEALETMKRKSRNYAKRQETWFRSVKDATTLDASTLTIQQLAATIAKEWKNPSPDI